MSKIYVIQDESDKIIAVSEKRNDLEAALLRMKISNYDVLYNLI